MVEQRGTSGEHSVNKGGQREFVAQESEPVSEGAGASSNGKIFLNPVQHQRYFVQVWTVLDPKMVWTKSYFARKYGSVQGTFVDLSGPQNGLDKVVYHS